LLLLILLLLLLFLLLLLLILKLLMLFELEISNAKNRKKELAIPSRACRKRGGLFPGRGREWRGLKTLKAARLLLEGILAPVDIEESA
jgi:hypothetical protein